ncbi:MAG: hypothetical protein CVU11_02205 [Bacteroidetes bacterium HGW-Bacteroidetes-6]|jgi:hypothetical protein|nr:MAG: hypothetical protein CVU11_02205 [Bacteroidetes bacterium HGW-Bacteroidetes-6]
MNWKLENIDELGRKTLGKIEKTPPPMSFKKIRKRVAWFSFWSLGAGSVIRHYWMIPATTAVVAFIAVWFYHTPKTEELAKQALSNKHQHEFNSTIAQNYTESSSSANNLDNYNSNHTFSVFNNNESYFDGPDCDNSNTTSASKQISPLVYTSKNENSNTIKTNTQNPDVQLVAVNLTTAQNKIQTELKSAYNKLGLIESHEIAIPFILNCKTIAVRQLVKQNINWSVFGGAAFLHTGSYNTLCNSTPDIDNRLAISISPAAEIRADFGKWFFSTGFQEISLNNSYHAGELLYNQRVTTDYELISQDWFVDSIGYWHYTYVADSIIHISDSTWEYQTDSLLVQQFDSVLNIRHDTLHDVAWKQNLKLLEIPLLAGKTFIFNRFMFGISAGFGIGYYYQASGNIYNGLYSHEPFSKNRMPDKPFSLSLLARGSATYFFNERMGFEVAPYFRKALISPSSSSENNSGKPYSAGLFVGIRYYF